MFLIFFIISNIFCITNIITNYNHKSHPSWTGSHPGPVMAQAETWTPIAPPTRCKRSNGRLEVCPEQPENFWYLNASDMKLYLSFFFWLGSARVPLPRHYQATELSGSVVDG